MYKYRKLRGRIIERYGTQGEFAKAIGLSRTGLSNKLTCKSEFTQSDIVKWADKLGIEQDEYPSYFFE